MTFGPTPMSRALAPLLLAAVMGLGACATRPTGPAVMVLPGTGKSFDQFRFDESGCRQYAYEQVGGVTPAKAADESAVRSAAAGTVLGAAAGAAIDGSSGAATGAGVGLLVGGLAGAGAAEGSAYGAQHRYDNAYLQCMYAKGHKIPVSGRFTSSSPAPGSYYPPPPPPHQPPPR
jgi:outer membrane lipoprotein SlyB